MAKISKCPECRQKVTLPTGVEESALVRCPLCDGEFLLAKATPDAEEAPPELVPLTPVAQDPAADRADMAADQAESKSEAEDADPTESVEAPQQLKAWERVSDMPQIDLGAGRGNESEAAEGADAIDFDAVKTDDEPSTGATPAIRRRRGRKEKSVFREMLGVIFGGFGGVLLAYYFLNLFGGPRFDFAEVYLPGIKHTAAHRPDWWPGWLVFESDSDEQTPKDGDANPGATQGPAGSTGSGFSTLDLPDLSQPDGQAPTWGKDLDGSGSTKSASAEPAEKLSKTSSLDSPTGSATKELEGKPSPTKPR